MGTTHSSAGHQSDISPEALPRFLAFEHPFFTKVEGSFFQVRPNTGEPVMCVNIAENEVLLPFRGLKNEFNLGEADCQMLDLLSQGLKYVSALRLGDPLPKEIITGEATWELSPRHKLIAHQRVSMQLVNWLTGVEEVISDPEQLIQLAEDPTIKKRIQAAFGEAAERLGIGRQNREQMVQYIEKVSTELAYIEALRDKFHHVQDVQKKVVGLRQVYARERSVAQSIDQIVKLFELAIADFSRRFLELDAQTGEIIAVLKNLENQVLFIRDRRDDLHVRLMAWDDILQEWRKVEVAMSYHIVKQLAQIYQFLAPRFMKVDEWVMLTKLQDKRQSMDELQKKRKVLVW